jgi:hypothetical protein
VQPAGRNLAIATATLAVLVGAGALSWRWYQDDSELWTFNGKVNQLRERTKAETRRQLGAPSRITHPRFGDDDECWIYETLRARNHVCFDDRGKMISNGGGPRELFRDDVEVEFRNRPPSFDATELATLRRIYPKLLPYFQNPDDFFVSGMKRQGAKLYIEVAGLSQLKAYAVRVNGKEKGGMMLLDDRDVPVWFVFDQQLALERCTTNFGRPCPVVAL